MGGEAVCRAASGLPEDRHVVARNQRIAGDHLKAASSSLRNKQAVERITVNHWQGRQPKHIFPGGRDTNYAMMASSLPQIVMLVPVNRRGHPAPSYQKWYDKQKIIAPAAVKHIPQGW